MSEHHERAARAHSAKLQRQRRARKIRIDYTPSPRALAYVEAKRASCRKGSAAATNSGVIDAIVIEWAALSQIHKAQGAQSIFTGSAPQSSNQGAPATVPSGVELTTSDKASDVISGSCHVEPLAPARANDFGKAHETRCQKPKCGARTSTGSACAAKVCSGRKRCKWHGGLSTGPRTVEGRKRSAANLPKRDSLTRT